MDPHRVFLNQDKLKQLIKSAQDGFTRHKTHPKSITTLVSGPKPTESLWGLTLCARTPFENTVTSYWVLPGTVDTNNCATGC